MEHPQLMAVADEEEQNMQELDLTWGRSMRVWWLMVWRGAVGGIVFGVIVGAITGFVIAILQGSIQTITAVSATLGYIVGLVWSMFVVRMALAKRYKEFRIALVPPASS
jgi:hypothetical protein